MALRTTTSLMISRNIRLTRILKVCLSLYITLSSNVVYLLGLVILITALLDFIMNYAWFYMLISENYRDWNHTV